MFHFRHRPPPLLFQIVHVVLGLEVAIAIELFPQYPFFVILIKLNVEVQIFNHVFLTVSLVCFFSCILFFPFLFPLSIFTSFSCPPQQVPQPVRPQKHSHPSSTLKISNDMIYNMFAPPISNIKIYLLLSLLGWNTKEYCYLCSYLLHPFKAVVTS